MPVFLDCLLDGELQKLIRIDLPQEEYPDPEEIVDHWISLYSDYNTRTGSDAVPALILQVWQRDCLASKIATVKNYIATLLLQYNETIVECLRQWGFIVPNYDGDNDVWETNMRRLEGQVKGLDFQLKKMDDLLMAMKKGETTRADFRKQLRAVSYWAKFMIKIEDLTVAEYCEHVKDYMEYAEQLNKDNDGG
jgi:hypothetical protein